MNSQHDKAKRWRPRFSVRTLAIVVTLVCCYAACWGPTKRQGVEDVRQLLTSNDFYSDIGDPHLLTSSFHCKFGDPCPVLPLLVIVDPEGTGGMDVFSIGSYTEIERRKYFKRHYFFWFFGYVAKLPYEREVDRRPSRLQDFIRGGPLSGRWQ